MALIVETGAGLADAESFISVADADTYFSNRGNTAWAALATDAKEANLRKATDYMEQVYRLSWAGYRNSEAQALSWPRDEVPRIDFTYLNQRAYYANDIVPVEVQNACAELAYRASVADLSPDVGQRVLREKIDVIEVEYAPYGAQYTTYRAIDNMLAPFLGAGGSGAFRKVQRT